ncbi:MAG: tRNA (adenosine(37)-N6)-threonylcarbamoyltransferase complex transferase subunit TsaD, partial [Myxococcota bacterium]|nr:tRNA (adenosine(37)-N6)-threonylcarbamoyltransferase complex transferase subunit TsaD [Myxococcota bacterium]
GPGGEVLGEALRSQVDDHRIFGGVVPELASRCHVEAIEPVVEEALSQAGLSLDQVGSIASTAGPGLVGCLLVGLSFAQGVAAARDIPFLGINHLEGHLLAPFIGQPEPAFPFVGLIVSGGHTLLVLARGVGDYEVLGETRDDAAGEAFDKGARLLGLPYPGGIAIDRLAREGDSGAVDLPRGLSRRGNLEFSFSGLKTAVWKHVQSSGVPEGEALNDFCASLQEAIVDVLLRKTRSAVEEHGVNRVVVTGGVAANSRLRALFDETARTDGWELCVPERRWCTDNATMIGYVAALRLTRGDRSPLSLDAYPGLSFGQVPGRN